MLSVLAWSSMINVMNKSGVYKITIGKRFYFGSTKGSLAERNYHHGYLLTKNIHPNRRMQNSYNKYKEMKFEVLLVCEPEFARDYEQYFIDQHFGKNECLNMKESSRGGTNVERIDIEEAKRLYYEKKWNLEEIGKHFGGLSFTTISARMTEAGCKLRKSNQVARIELPPSIADDYKNDMSLRDIAANHGVTHTVVRSRLIELGVTLREVGTPNEATDEDLKRMYLEEKLSSIQIGKKLSMSRSGVTKRLRAILGKDIKAVKLSSTFM